MSGKSSKPAKGRIHDNFRDLVLQATQANSKDFITKQVSRAAQIIAKDLADQFKPYDLLFDVFQDIIIEMNDKLSKDIIRKRVFDKEDTLLGLVENTEAAKQGDRVRFKLKDITRADSEQLLAVDKLANTPPELNKDVEEAMVGMKAGELKVVTTKLPDGKEYNFEVCVIRASSRVPAVTTTEVKEPSNV